MDSKELFNKIKNNRIRFSEVKKKLNETKIGKKNDKQKDVIDNLTKFYNSREEVINFCADYVEMFSDANYNAKQNETRQDGAGLKI